MSKNEINKQSMYQKIMPTLSSKVDDVVEDSPLEVANEVIIEEITEMEIEPVESSYVSERVLVNLAELAVKQRIDEAFSKFKCCQCTKCVMDVTALSLNNLPNQYMVLNVDEVESVVSKYSENVVPALVKAVMVVKANPRH